MFKRIDRRYKIIGVLILLIIALTVRTLTSDRETTVVEKVITDTFETVEYHLIKRPIEIIGDIRDELNDISNVYEENKLLKQQLGSYAIAQSQIDVLNDELDRLKNQLEIDCLPSEYSTTTTYVMSRDVETWSSEILIGVGKQNSDVDKNMAVVSDSGLIGYVSSVNEFTSTVTLLTSEKLSKEIPVVIQDEEGNECFGLLKKYDTELQCYEIDMFVSSEFAEDTPVYTSGLGGDIPSGIYIGTISSITVSNSEFNPTINVLPSVDFDQLRYVSVVQRSDMNE